MLCRKFEHERHKLQSKTCSAIQAFNADLSICVFSSTVLCTQSGVDNWIPTLPFVDETSLLLDMWLLQELSKIVVFKVDDIQPVRYKFLLYFAELYSFLSSKNVSDTYHLNLDGKKLKKHQACSFVSI